MLRGICLIPEQLNVHVGYSVRGDQTCLGMGGQMVEREREGKRDRESGRERGRERGRGRGER